MPRYVLLRHELPPAAGRASHWDFMLEHEGLLWTWALDRLPKSWCEQLNLPRENASDEVPARRLADHRLTYLAYEGPVSGNRGKVTRVAKGEYKIINDHTERMEAQLADDLQGIATLTRENDAPDHWQIEFAAEI